ncbi:MAG: hypothetical protein IPP93_04085 [Chitinophagaceae bacterium]|nr:hypothetical protein [Chitinophagaceae bacterium]MBL0334318.1 hypothetical protein [Chitinophagaceae bacterium]
MKSRITAFIAAVVIFSSCSKSDVTPNNPATGTANVVAASSVPAAARTALSTNFSGATEVEWQRHSSSDFSAQFNLSSQRHEAHFDDHGGHSSHSVICLDAPVPSTVLDAFRTRFATDNVYEWKLGGDGNWKAHFMRGTVKYEATFSPSGTLVKFEQAG